MDYLGRQRLRDAWLSFLSRYPWQVFFTISYRDEIPARLAIDRAARWLHGLWSVYSDRVDSMMAFIVAEQFRFRGGYHCHGLMYTSPISYLDIPDSLRMGWLHGRELFESMVRMEGIRSVGNVQGYVSKYLTKGFEYREPDYDIVSWCLDNNRLL